MEPTRDTRVFASDHVTQAKLQLRLVTATYRQHVARTSSDGDAAAAFRERARPILDSVEFDHAHEPAVAQALAEVPREFDAV